MKCSPRGGVGEEKKRAPKNWVVVMEVRIVAAELLVRIAIFSVGPFSSLATRWDSTPGSLFWKASRPCNVRRRCTSQPGPLKMLNLISTRACRQTHLRYLGTYHPIVR